MPNLKIDRYFKILILTHETYILLAVTFVS